MPRYRYTCASSFNDFPLSSGGVRVVLSVPASSLLLGARGGGRSADPDPEPEEFRDKGE